MSESNFSSDLKYLFGSRKKSIARLALTGLIISIIFAVFVEAYFSINNYLNQFSNNIQISLVLKSYADSTVSDNKQDTLDSETGKYSDSLLTETINSIVTKPWTKSYKIISSEEANEEFRTRYGEISSELMPVNPFPQILSVTIRNKFHDRFNFNKIVSYLKSMELIDEVRYRDDFIQSYFNLKRNIILAAVNIALLFILILTFLLFQTARTEFDGSETKLTIFCFVVLSIFIGTIISIGAILGLKELINYQFAIPLSLNIYLILYALIASIIFSKIVLIFTALFIKTKENDAIVNYNVDDNKHEEINE